MTTAAFWDKIASGYAARPIANMPAYEHTLARTRSYLHPEDRLLEIGAGTGGTARALAPHVAHVTTTDIAPAMIEIAEARAAEAGVANVTHQVATLEDGTMPDGPFDAVIAFNLLHLVPDTAAAIGAVRARLKPGGYFISKTGCIGGIYALMMPIIWAMQALGKAPPVRVLTRAGLERRMIAAGFEILETGDFPRRPPAHFIVARAP